MEQQHLFSASYVIIIFFNILLPFLLFEPLKNTLLHNRIRKLNKQEIRGHGLAVGVANKVYNCNIGILFHCYHIFTVWAES